MKRAPRPRTTTIFKPHSFASLFVFVLAVMVIAMFASVTAFMQEPNGGETQSKETRIEPPTIKTPLGPGVALSYPELDIDQQLENQTTDQTSDKKTFVESPRQTVAIAARAVPVSPAAAVTC